MKKVILTVAVAILSLLGYSQAVIDNAIIPMSVTLNSILRLNVTSGGNIEFAVNTIKQYTDGIANSSVYDTEFTVASSIDFDVVLFSEDENLVGSDLAAGTNIMPVNYIGYTVEKTGSGTVGATGDAANYSLAGLGASPSALQLLGNTPFEVVTSLAVSENTNHLGGAGDIVKNKFLVNWELATSAVITEIGSTGKTLLQMGLPSDRYSTNVFITLKAHD